MIYRGYVIVKCEYGGFLFGINCDENPYWTGENGTIEDAKDEIDTILYESGFSSIEKGFKKWIIVFKDEILTSDSFIDALECAWRNNAIRLEPREQFVKLDF